MMEAPEPHPPGDRPLEPVPEPDRAAAPAPAAPGPVRFLRSAATAWAGGILAVALFSLSCVDRLPWGACLLPLGVLAACLAARAAASWPKIGFPACVLGVGSLVTAAGLFKAGIGWSREWEALRNAGSVPLDSGISPILGTGLAVLAGGAFLAVLFLHGEQVWRALLNIRLAVTTLATIGLLSVLGTMVVQRLGAGGLPEPERDFVEKFMKGQGGVPVNARFMVAPPEVVLSAAEKERIELLGKAFGEGKARQMRLTFEGMHARGAKATAIERHVEERREHLTRLFERFESLGFTMVFRTWWFNSLLALLAVQIVALLVHRWPWPRAKAGWVTTHVGVLIVLVGCMISDGFLRDGSLALSPGEYSTQFEETTRPGPHGGPALTDLGYRVVMLGTDQSFYHELEIAFPTTESSTGILWTQEQLRPGRRIPVKDPGGKASYEIRILEVHERCLVEHGMVSGARTGQSGGVPALRLQFLDTGPGHEGHGHGDEGHLVEDGWIAAGGPEGEPIRYFSAASPDEARGLIDGAGLRDEGKHGTLVVRVPGVPEPVSIPASPGAKAVATDAAGAAWTIEIRRFYPRFTVEAMRQEQEAGAPEGTPPDDGATPVSNPVLAVEVRRAVEGGAEESGRTLAFGVPDLQAQWEGMISGKDAHAPDTGSLGRGPAGECAFEFRFAPSSRIWIVEGPGVERTLVFHRRGEAPERRPFAAAGTTVPVPGRDLSLRLAEALPDAVPDLRIRPLAQESDEEYLETSLRTLQTGRPPPLTASAARIEVVERDEAGERTRSEWLVARKEEFVDGRRIPVVDARIFRSTDGRILLGMVETQNSLMFRSALEVQSLDGKPLLRDGKPFRTVVRVNHPLQWGGYAFYQNNFTPAAGDRPAVSVFRVKYDRGIPLVYTGFAVLTLGVCVMLYFDPFFRRRRQAAAAGAGAPQGGT